jgi:hypothetical protein
MISPVCRSEELSRAAGAGASLCPFCVASVDEGDQSRLGGGSVAQAGAVMFWDHRPAAVALFAQLEEGEIAGPIGEGDRPQAPPQDQ